MIQLDAAGHREAAPAEPDRIELRQLEASDGGARRPLAATAGPWPAVPPRRSTLERRPCLLSASEQQRRNLSKDRHYQIHCQTMKASVYGTGWRKTP